MKISVVTVCFNSASTIRDAIDSVLSQGYPEIEYIIVDGGSTDRTLDIIREYEDRIDTLISEPDRGIYDAMNKGIGLATGEVIGLLNSDDFYADESVVGQLIDCMQRTRVDTVFADLAIVDANDTQRVKRYYSSANFHPGKLRYGWMPAHPTLFVRRAVYERVGNYSLDYRIAADFEMMVRIYHVAGCSYSYLPLVAVMMRAGGISTGGFGNSWLLNREIVRACRAYGLATSLPRVLLKIPAKLMEYLTVRR